jgi:hypothetical protein
MAVGTGTAGEKQTLDVTASGDKKKQPLTVAVSGCSGVELTGIEPVTSRMPFGASISRGIMPVRDNERKYVIQSLLT